MGYLSFDCSCKIHASGRFTSTKTDMTGSGGIAGFFATFPEILINKMDVK